jgi:aspartokinase
MLKISDAIREIIDTNSFLNFGICNHLLNLSKVAEFIKPLIETRAKKDIKTSAILMGLSRLQKEKCGQKVVTEKYEIVNLTVRSNLCSMTFFESYEVRKNISEIYKEIKKQSGRITIIQSIDEVAIIIDDGHIPTIEKFIHEKPKNIQKNLAALGVYFDPRHYEMPGFIHYITQQIAFQGISIYEIASTFSELTIYVDQKNIRLLFDTIHNCFSKK